MNDETTSHAEHLRARAAARYEAGDLRGAYECFRSLLDLCPHAPDILSDAGTVCFALGRADQARGYYVRALRIDPTCAAARRNLEMLCRASGASLEAVLHGAGSGRPCARDISVVVPVNSRFDVVARCLESLYNQTFAPGRYEVLPVANGVGPEAAGELLSMLEPWQRLFGERLRLIDVPQASIALARNEGIRQAEGAVVMQINEDSILSRTTLEQHWAAHEEFGFNPRCVLLGGRRFPASYLRRLFNYLYEAASLYMPLHRRRPRFPGDYQWLVTCNLSSLREAYERFGFYDPTYSWGSDTELGRRWDTAGCLDLYVDTSIVSYHLHELTFEGHRSNCIKRAPFQFRRERGCWPWEATDEQREEARTAVAAEDMDVDAFEQDLLRLEEEFTGPEAFAGATVMGRSAPTLGEFNYLLIPLIKAYRRHLYNAELLRLMEEGRKEVAVL